MIIDFSMEDTVTKRSSVRSYSDRELEDDLIGAIERFVETLDNPFGKEVLFHFFDAEALTHQQKLGTYGVIRGAKRFIGANIKMEPLALEALGYEMEAVILYLTSLGLGSCWLGGTFNRKGFAKAMDIDDDQLLPAITPYGWGATKIHLIEGLMRKMIRADQRKPWEQLFFNGDFKTPLTKQSAGEMAFALEMLRLGPSASNKQPWRVLLKDGVWHFFEYRSPGYSDAFSYDIQRLDMGIAAAHFDLSAQEKGIKGRFDLDNTARLEFDGETRLEFDGETELKLPDHFEYAYSWRRE